MTDQQTLRIDEDAVRALADKLAAFTATLEPAEAAALALLVQRPAGDGDDVQGYGLWDTISSAGWFHHISDALLATALAEGMLADDRVLEQFISRDNSGQPARAARDDEREARSSGVAPVPAT
ncbi:MAG: hypothetical protein ACTHMP_24065 [Thermomicrobiales bacterium]